MLCASAQQGGRERWGSIDVWRVSSVHSTTDDLQIWIFIWRRRRRARSRHFNCLLMPHKDYLQEAEMKGNHRSSSDIQASSLAHLLAGRLLVNYCGIELPDATLNGSKLSETAIRTVCDFIEANLCTQLTLEDLAALVHLSPFHFARCFKASIGLAPHQYVIARRMELAKRLLLTSTHTVAEIAWSIGYENISHFGRLFTTHIGVTPGTIRRAAAIQPRV